MAGFWREAGWLPRLLLALHGNLLQETGSAQALVEGLVSLLELPASESSVPLVVVGEEVRDVSQALEWDLIEEAGFAQALVEGLVSLLELPASEPFVLLVVAPEVRMETGWKGCVVRR